MPNQKSFFRQLRTIFKGDTEFDFSKVKEQLKQKSIKAPTLADELGLLKGKEILITQKNKETRGTLEAIYENGQNLTLKLRTADGLTPLINVANVESITPVLDR